MSNQNLNDPAGKREGVFISYARKDGEGFAARLRERLKAEGIHFVWQDREQMYGGHNWWLQISDALEHVEFLVLVVTEAAIESRVVHKEWRRGLQEGVCVFGVKGSPDVKLEKLPGWIGSKHIYDIGTLEGGQDGPNWTKFLNDLKTICQQPRVPFMAGDLPAEYVERREELEKVKNGLLDRKREETVAITAALRGAGGFGKTTLAKALCDDDDVQTFFHDGVLWTTLGEEPGDLRPRVDDLIQALTGKRAGFDRIDSLTARLKELLADRVLLIVVDDVWNAAHLRPFNEGGPRCARLITTRVLDAVPAKATKVPVDAMQPAEAISLLRFDLPPEQDQEFFALASRLGEWPLLLKLANGVLRYRVHDTGQPLADALAFVGEDLEENGLVAFDAAVPEERDQAVSATLGMSLKLLGEEERRRFGELAVFPEDVDVPLAALQKLWGLSRVNTEKLCDRYNRLSLLYSFDPVAKTVRLHDVVWKYLRREQGDELLALHGRLLDLHRPPPPAGTQPSLADWAALPFGEPYLWDHLAYHLKEAGRGDELLATVKDLRFLANKTFARNPVAVEGDLFVAEKLYPEDAALNLLRRSYARFGHLFDRHENANDLAAALFSRLQHLDALAPLTRELEKALAPPYLAPFQRLPDLPHPAFVRTLQGHEAYVSDCAISPDSSLIVSASLDGTLKVWNAKTGAVLHTLAEHGDEVVFGCAFSPDGASIVSASSDRTLKVWDAESGKERLTLTGHADAVKACAVSADGTLIVSASDDRTLKIWEAQSGKELRTLSGHSKKVTDCAVSSDGSFIVSASEDGTLKVWDVETGHERFTIRVSDTYMVSSCSISPDDSYIVSGSWNNNLSIWDVRDGSKLRSLNEPSFFISACAVSPDGSFIVSASWDKTLRVWDAVSGVELRVLTGHTSDVNSCAISPDGSFIVSASEDRTLRVWDARSEDAASPVAGHKQIVHSCAVSPDGARVVTGSWDNVLIIWDAEGGKEHARLAAPGSRVIRCSISRDGTTLVSASNDGVLKLWDAENGRELRTLGGHTVLVNDCVISSDGSFIVSASDDRTLTVWDARSGGVRVTLAGHAEGVHRCCISPDDSFIVSASEDKTLKLWDTRDWTEKHTFSGHTEAVYGCNTSPDGALVISTSLDKTVKVWDVSTRKELRTLAGHKNTVLGCAMSSDGGLLASVSFDGELKIWDALKWNCLTSLYVDGALNDCAWFPDNRRLVAVGTGGVYFLRLVL